MSPKILAILTTALFLFSANGQNQKLDVLHYHLKIEPNIESKTIRGTVQLKVKANPDQKSISFKTNDLEVLEVDGTNLGSHSVGEKTLKIDLSQNDEPEITITIKYRGTPRHGLIFDQEKNQAHTVYFTNHWMICNDDPSDKATFSMELLIPENRQCVASGKLSKISTQEDKIRYFWNQDYPTPTYTYGFAIGSFEKLEMSYKDVSIKSYTTTDNPIDLQQVFGKTPDVIRFFEEKSGIPYDQESYSQILMGEYYQEMSGFAILKEGYGDLVLKDSTETNLISHELAHQWWGNRITCENWNHFWLNEGLVTFMSAAYNEHRFGAEKYESDIFAYRKVFKEIKGRGKDKSLVFESWTNPSRDDRNLVYFKGAYVIHLLRQELGEEAFWSGIRKYSRDFFDKTVTTKDFQTAMEESSRRDLSDFFGEWVY